jgi:S-adenosylmethionine:tRNA ribosyltransferase-isomerase
MRTTDFDFHLPKDLIALRPSERRDNSRLLVLHRNGNIDHRRFSDIAEYLNKGDMLVLNNTKVFPARIIATKPSGRKIDILLIKDTNKDGTWEIMCRGKFNGMVTIGNGVKAEVWTEKSQESRVNGQGSKKFLRFLGIKPSKVKDILWQYGYMPLPPYINRMPDETDKQRYQTVYAENQGSIAAPTAGLHFTEELLNNIRNKGVCVEMLTLHVGSGTFKPIKAEFLEGHIMDAEYFEIKTSLMERIQRIKETGGRLITVGTTATRAIEAVASGQWSAVSSKKNISNSLNSLDGSLKGWTDIFIYPGYKFNVVDSLITNFHLPRSTPLMLVSALRGFKEILHAYKEAIAMGYRFFSYGDAMLIL